MYVSGISVDWEFPDPGTEVANHVKLIEELTSEIAASSNPNIKIGVAVGGEYKGSANHLNYIHTDLFNSNCVIFKHSKRCIISRMVLYKFEYDYNKTEVIRMMNQDGFGVFNWDDLHATMNRICVDKALKE